MENHFCRNLLPKENWLEMLHYFVDMQNKTPQALIDQAKSDGRREKMLLLWKKHRLPRLLI
jgi:hypothetical protein